MTAHPDRTFVQPRYDSGGFSSLPGRVAEYFNRDQYDTVLLFLLDGFGWRQFERFQDESLLKELSHKGRVVKLLAQFPSTTAAQLTTIHTGQPVGEHGVFEWNYYEPKLDAVIAPLLFSFAGTLQRDTLKTVDANPKMVLPGKTIYKTLANQGVKATIFQHREYTPSTYSNAMFRGAHSVGYRTLAEGLVNLGETMAKATGRVFLNFYFDRIDGISHEYGPESSQSAAEIQSVLMTLEAFFRRNIRPRGRTLVMLTADHGQSEVDPRTTVFINTDPRFSGVTDYFRRSRDGKLVAPGGSCRDFFLYIREGLVDEACEFLATRLEGKAEVWKVAEMITAGNFGSTISAEFRGRVGDLVILPYRRESVWWYEKDRFNQKYYGHHGGLSAEEMEIPLLTWEM